MEGDRELLRGAEWLAERYGLSLDEALRGLRETSERVARWGLDAEVRRAARQYGISEDEVWADYERCAAAWEQRKASDAQFGSSDEL